VSWSAPWWILGDSWADPYAYAWAPEQGWPQLLAARFDAGVINSAAAGSGYAANRGTPHFPTQAARGTGAGAPVVIVFGSINDPNNGYTPEQTAAGARVTFALVRRACPDALRLVTGPQILTLTPADLSVHDAVRVEATAAGGIFLDVSSWLIGRPDLMLNDTHPNQGGHALIADRLTPELLWALTPAPPTLPHGDLVEPGWVAPYTIGAAATLPSPSIGSEV
jgi:lysophospholipase L1-like esterase